MAEKSFSKTLAIFALALVVLFAQPIAAATTVTVCQGETAKYDFKLENTGDPLTYTLSVSGISGTLSQNSISMPADSQTTFSLTVPTSTKSVGTYDFKVTATSTRTTAVADATLIVQNCFQSQTAVTLSQTSAKQCDSTKATVTISNKGSKDDSFTLSSSGSLLISFSQNPVFVAAGTSKSVDATITIPCSQQTGTAAQTITSAGKSSSSSTFQLQVALKPTPTPSPTPAPTATPSPTPKPLGCLYKNPSCQEGFECINNNCYKTVTVNNTVYVTVTPKPTLAPTAKPVIVDTSLQLSSIRVCKNETAKVNFAIYNPLNETQSIILESKGVQGILSTSNLSIASRTSGTFAYYVDSTSLEIGTYSISIATINANSNKTQYVGEKLEVEDCFASNLSVINAYPIAGTTPAPQPTATQQPSTEPTAAAQTATPTSTQSPTATAQATQTPAASASPTAPVAIESEGAVSMEVGSEKEFEVKITNNGAESITQATLSISGATLSNAKLPDIAPNTAVEIKVKITGQKEGTFKEKISLKSADKTVAEQNVTLYVGKALLEIQQKKTAIVYYQTADNKTMANSTTYFTLKNSGAKIQGTLSLSGAGTNSHLSNETITIGRGETAEISIQTIFEKDARDIQAKIIFESARGTLEYPATLSARPASATITGLFAGALSNWPYVLAVILVILSLYLVATGKMPGFSKKEDDDESDETGEDESEDETEEESESDEDGEKKAKKKKK